MPPKKNDTPKRGAGKATTEVNKVKCDLCLAAIVNNKDDALQCEGSCQLWFHRYCAGVSLSHFKSLANSSKPFVCLHCSQEHHQVVVNELKSEVASLKAEVAELREGVKAENTQALVTEIMQLKSALAKLQETPKQETGVRDNKREQNESSSGTWSEVVQCKRQQSPGEQAAAHSATELGKPSTTGSKQASHTHLGNITLCYMVYQSVLPALLGLIA